MKKSLEQLAKEDQEKKAKKLEYINNLDLYHKSQVELRQLLCFYENNAYGRRVFGIEQDSENEIIMDAIKTVISTNGGRNFIDGCVNGFVK